MSPGEIKLWGGLALLLLFWRRAAAAPTGTVDIGTPTVSGSGSEEFGGQDYGIAPPPIPADGVGGSDARMQQLIRQSTAVILANGGYPE